VTFDHAPEPIDPDAAPPDEALPVRDPLHPSASSRRRVHPRMLAALGGGGAIGTGARDWIATAVHVSPGTFPWATFWINVSGSFVLGVGLMLILERFPPSRYVRPFFGTGICGGFTTFSTFVVETDLLVHDRAPLVAVAYLFGTAVCGLAAGMLGVIGGRVLPLELAPLIGHRVSPRRKTLR
jgi:CrcB protein